MPYDSGTLSVASLIAHKVPHRLKSAPIAVFPLSQALPTVPAETLGFFAKRLIRAMGAGGQSIEIDPAVTAVFLAPLMVHVLSGNLDLVAFSQDAARHLYMSQGGSSSEGLLLACGLAMAGQGALAVMKLEEEEGVQVEDSIVNGQPTLSVTVLDNLLLTENTRVFKAGVFWLEDGVLKGMVSDEQQGHPSRIADYFLSEFLGCRLERLPAVLTQSFADTVYEFISNQVTDQDKKLDYQNALSVELASTKPRIAPLEFITDHFDLAHRQPLLDALTARNLPHQAFFKDIGLLGSRPEKARLRTAHGITISGKQEEINDRVSTHVSEDGVSVITIRDTLTAVD